MSDDAQAEAERAWWRIAESARRTILKRAHDGERDFATAAAVLIAGDRIAMALADLAAATAEAVKVQRDMIALMRAPPPPPPYPGTRQ